MPRTETLRIRGPHRLTVGEVASLLGIGGTLSRLELEGVEDRAPRRPPASSKPLSALQELFILPYRDFAGRQIADNSSFARFRWRNLVHSPHERVSNILRHTLNHHLD